MPRKPRSQPRPCQSIPDRSQSIDCVTSRASRSMRYTPPWLSPWWLPRTTDVATSFNGQERVRRKPSPSLAERNRVGPRLLQGADVPESRIVELSPVVRAAQIGVAVLVESIAHDERRVPAVFARVAHLECRRPPLGTQEFTCEVLRNWVISI